MNTLWMTLRMASRRWGSNLLVLVLIVSMTVFLLLYPGVIARVEQELSEVYASIIPEGWIYHVKEQTDPMIPLAVLDDLLDTGFIREHQSVGQVFFSDIQEAVTVLSENEAVFAQKTAEQQLEYIKNAVMGIKLEAAEHKFYAISDIRAENSILRQQDNLVWLDGYSVACFQGDEAVCVYPKDMGVELGQEVQLILRNRNKDDYTKDTYRQVVTLKVVGLHPIGSANGGKAYVPLAGFRQLLGDQEEAWDFTLNRLTFSVQNSEQLPGFKDALTELGLNDPEGLHAAIDDRILQGTVAPIQRNLSLLENLHGFLYAAVIGIGFFLCFLLARGRKPEYAVMRLLGESTAQVTFKAMTEQLVLCLLGILLGTGTLLIAGQGSPDISACGAVLVCYILGAALAVMLTVRVNVMEILRDKE